MQKRELWVDLSNDINQTNKKDLIVDCLELGVDTIIVDTKDVELAKTIGNIRVATYDDLSGDVVIIGRGGEGDGTKPLSKDLSDSIDFKSIKDAKKNGKTSAYYICILNKEYERRAVDLGRYCDYLIIIGKDWKIVPTENIITGLQNAKTKIIMGVETVEDAKVAFETMERGVDGVLLSFKDKSMGVDHRKMIKDILDLKEKSLSIKLEPVRVTKVNKVGMGDRVCIDTCSLMTEGEGMLIGSFSSGFFLVQAEVNESEYVSSRPFRVNAGAIHSYIMNGDKTNYLSELKGGDEVLIVNDKGRINKAVIGRVKIEKRPLIQISAEKNGDRIEVILQNAETVNLVKPDGKPISVSKIKEGDEVIAYLTKKGRHFGAEIDESIIER